MIFRIFVEHSDYGAQSVIAATFAALGLPVYATLANYGSRVPKGVAVVPPYRTHPTHFKFYLSACNIVILSDKDPAEGQLILDLLEERFFVGHVFLISTYLTWGRLPLSSLGASEGEPVESGSRRLSPEQYTHRRALPEVQGVKLLEDRIANMLTKQYTDDDPLQPCIRGSIISHGLLYDSYTAEGNELMELVDFVVENGVLPTFSTQASYIVSVTSCSRVAIELRNFLQNTVEQGVNLQNVCPFRFVVDEDIPLDTLLNCINEGVYGCKRLTPAPMSKLEMLSRGLSTRLISLLSLNLAPEPNPVDDFSFSNSQMYVAYKRDGDHVLESVQQILSASAITETPHIVESVQGYITASVLLRRPRYTVVLLGTQACFCIEDKAALLSSSLNTPILSLPLALRDLVQLGENAKTPAFWSSLLNSDLLPIKVEQPLTSGKPGKANIEPVSIEDKAALLIKIIHNLPASGSTTNLLLSTASSAAYSLQIKGFVAAVFMLHLRTRALAANGYIFVPDLMSSADLSSLLTTPLELFLDQMIIDPALAGDSKKAAPKGEPPFGVALLAQEDIKSLPTHVPIAHIFSHQRVVVNPLLVEVTTNPDTALKKQDSYNTYKLLAASLDRFLVESIRQGVEIVDDRVVVSCHPCLPGELRFAPIFIDVSSLNISIKALTRAYLLTAGRARLNLLKQQSQSDLHLTSQIEVLNSRFIDLNDSNWRSTIMKQLAVLRQVHAASNGYYELIGEHPTPTSILVSIHSLKSIYGPEAILSEIRGHVDPPTSTVTHLLVQASDDGTLQSKLPLANLMRFANIHPELQSINLLPNPVCEENLLVKSFAATSVPASSYDLTSDLYDVLVLRALSKLSTDTPAVHARDSTSETVRAGVKDVISSLNELALMLPSVEERGDLNVYEDVDIPEEPSEHKTNTKEPAESMLTPRSTRQESGNECSDEEEYPNTATGNLNYLRDTVAPYLQSALAICMTALGEKPSAERYIQCIVQEMYTEFYNANPDGLKPDSSVEC
ncbi:Hypothetical protein GSB_152523 [Giardia duodenalis]|uniref:Uncharacterized protein n=2 Tax=Giardia intestinalis TaxID=5741 RepID=C6LPB2_GIAIB|nr:Hypothetical protein GL50581_577 [Giardia intestinalis ATCC 50581]ESU41152.1 Hypothetical protein GSB_152523 [Giardia intestinalis]